MPDQTVLWPKEGRRQPIMVGRDSSGRPLPGGPYTIYQLGAVLVVGGIGLATRNLWGAALGIIAQLISVLGAAALALLAAGYVDFMKTNPLWSLTGWVRQVAARSTHPTRDVPHVRAGRRVRVLPLLDEQDDTPADPEPPKRGEAGDLAGATALAATDQPPFPADPHPPRSRRPPRLRLHRRPASSRPHHDPPPTAAEVGLDLLHATAPAAPQPQTHPPVPAAVASATGLEAFLAAADRSHP